MAKEWDESKHPRVPSGHGDKSGEWRSSLEFTEAEFVRDAEKYMLEANAAFFQEEITNEGRGKLKDELEKRLADRLKNNPDWTAYIEARKKHYSDNDYLYYGKKKQRADDISYSVIKDMIDDWADTSSDNDERAQFMQHIAKRVFNLSDTFDHHTLTYSAYSRKLFENFSKLSKSVARTERVPVELLVKSRAAFLTEMYSVTQSQLKERGLRNLYLVRGSTFNDRNSAPSIGYKKIKMNPISSFSTDIRNAAMFGDHFGESSPGRLTYVKVPASRVLSTPLSGFGCYGEREVVVLGGTLRGLVTQTPTELWKKNWSDQINRSVQEAWDASKK